MMGSRPFSRVHRSTTNSLEAESYSQPEEYILDTYTLPVDPEVHYTSRFFSSPLRKLPVQDSNSRPQRKHILGTSRFPYTYRIPPTEDIDIRTPPSAGLFRSAFDLPSAKGVKAWAGRESHSLQTPNSRGKGLLRPPSHQGDSIATTCRDPAEATALQDSIGIIHNDPIVRSCCGCHVVVKEGCERRSRPRQPPRSGLGATMGDLDGLGLGKGGRGARRAKHQLPFLKTVSIIDTLSELGPEVRHLAEEPNPTSPSELATPVAPHSGASSSSKRPPLPVEGSFSTPSRSNKASAFLVNSAGVDHPKGTPGPGLGPPLVSPDFQQYTEKIYDAVTRRLEPPALTARLKHHRARHLLSAAHSERLTKSQKKARDADGNGPKARLKDEASSVPKHRYSEQRGRERGRTPDWIKRIFDIAKLGDTEALKQGVADMEETLVRNLSDHGGNNLLHVMAVYGHLAPMAWMLTTHSILVDALQDENKFGLTPLVCSIRYGRLRVIQWLVEKTVVKDKVKCKDGERSLLHIAAKYAQEEIVAWLVEYMMKHEISLDNKDHHGNTALHLAARSGNSRLCSILLQHGADVTLKNDLGQKAWEVCVIRGHLACAEYLCVHESGLALATDLTRREAELEAAMADNHDLRINFKEVMSIARRLLREREEAVRELSRLHEHMMETHDNIIALHAFGDESYTSRNRTEGVGESQGTRTQVESVLSYINNLHERWQAVQKTWFGSSLVNMKHKMLLVEEAWKKLRHRSHRTVATTHHPLDVFRGKLGAVRAQGGEGRLGDLPSLCSSEESLVSFFPFTDDENDKDENYELVPSSSTPARGSIGHKFKSTEILPDGPPSRSETGAKSPPSSCFNVSSLGFITELSPGEELPKEEINARLKELALTSESGSCTVLEVIEPSSEDSDTHVDEDRCPELGNQNALDDGFNEPTKPSPGSCVDHPDRRGKRTPLRLCQGEAETNGSGGGTPSSENGPHLTPSGEQRETRNEKHFLTNETSVGTAASDVSAKGQRPQESTGAPDSILANGTIGIPPSSVTLAPSLMASPNGTTELIPQSALMTPFMKAMSTTPAAAVALKRKGFLHKLIKPPPWPSKRKVKTIRKLDSETTRDLLDSHRGGTRSPPPGDLDPHTTPESCTSSSQEYSNSSEESSIGKPTSTSSRPTELFQSYAGHGDSDTRPVPLSPSQEAVKSEKVTSPIIPLSTISSPCRSNSPPPLPSLRTILSATPSDTSLNTLSTLHLPVKGMENIKKNSVSEVRSIATSDDSGIVGRPASSASKSDTVSRPESSSSSTFPPFKGDYSLQKSTLSLTQDMLPDSSATGRMSPAPSEVSKTESALSPPLTVKTAAIISLTCEQKAKKPLQNALCEDTGGELPCTKKDRPWYELSDEESDILLPDRLTSKTVPRISSSEDETEIG